MQSQATILLEIDGIDDVSDRGGVRVILKGGRKIWLPGDHLGYVPGAVLVPEWLMKKIKGWLNKTGLN